MLTTQPSEISLNVIENIAMSLQKSQWKTSGDRAVVMKSQDLKFKFGSTTLKISKSSINSMDLVSNDLLSLTIHLQANFLDFEVIFHDFLLMLKQFY